VQAVRLGLVGDVKTMQVHPVAARDLFLSPLFEARRRYVERHCDVWYILSARHGLLHPDQVVGPYRGMLSLHSRPTKEKWAARVLWQLDHAWDYWKDTVVEIHAGADFRNFGLTDGLVDRGAKFEVPAEHLTGGGQLAFYAAAEVVDLRPDNGHEETLISYGPTAARP
jgi:hypothetical protein